jgi:hypothetical protein
VLFSHVTSNRYTSPEKVDRHLRHTQALEAHLGLDVATDWVATGRQLLTIHASFEQVTQAVQALIGPSGLPLLVKIEERVLLCMASHVAVRIESRNPLVRALTTTGVRRSRTSIGVTRTNGNTFDTHTALTR